MTNEALMEVRDVSMTYGTKVAAADLSMEVRPGEVLCLLGHNGAGKSTLIKILSGVVRPSEGTLLMDGQPVVFHSPREARGHGIATVHQEVGTIPLMSVGRNFFLGAEPAKGRGPFRRLNKKDIQRIALGEIHKLGIRGVTDANQMVGTLSGGERQALAIGRATYFGARVLILDEPTSDLGVRESDTVLKLIEKVRDQGVGVVLVTHNAHHAWSVGNQFVVLVHGRIAARFRKGERSPQDLINLMAGAKELEDLELKIDTMTMPQ